MDVHFHEALQRHEVKTGDAISKITDYIFSSNTIDNGKSEVTTIIYI